jgi:hypothetical protein
MRLTTMILAALAVSVAPAFAQQPPEPITDASGTIVMYRKGGFGIPVGCPIRHNGNQITDLGRGESYIWRVKPGRYMLGNKTASIEVSVDAGETRYVRCRLKSGDWVDHADLQVVDGAEYADLKDELKQLPES